MHSSASPPVSRQVLRCFEEIGERKGLVKKRFSECSTLLYHIMILMDDVVDESIERQRRDTCNRIKWLLELECPPFMHFVHE